MDVKTLCLGVLTEGDASGYDVKKHFECTFSHFFVAGFGSIYPALAELMRDGLVTCREETQSNRPDRKVYSLTAAGKEQFLRSLAATPPRHKLRSEFYVLLHFAHLLPPDRLRAVLDERMSKVTRDIQMIEQFLTAHERDECPGGPHRAFEAGLACATLRAHRDYIAAHRGALLQMVAQDLPEAAPEAE